MLRTLALATCSLMILGQGVIAQNVAQTSVVESALASSSSCGCNECQTVNSSCCKSCTRDVRGKTNGEFWDNDFYKNCGGGRVDWMAKPDDFCARNYLSFFGGFVNVDNFERQLVTGNVVDITTSEMLDGWGAGGSLGRQFHPLFRIETEFTYRDNVADNWEENTFTNGVPTASTVVDSTGSLQTYSWMNNFIVNFPPRKQGCPNLYAGGGIGILYAEGAIATATTNYNISDSSFAFQFIGGFNRPIRENVDFFTEYRYLGANNITVDDLTNAVSLGNFNFDSHSVFMGFRVFRR